MIQAENLEKVFNLPPSSQVIEGEFTVENTNVEVIKDKSVEVQKPNVKLDDSEFIRKNLKDLTENTKLALDLALQIQAEEPNFRNTEAVAKMADAVSKTLGNLIHLNKIEKDEEYRAKEPEETGPKVVNNTLIMTTEKLIEKIMSQTKQLKDK